MDKINNLKYRGFHAKFNHDLNQEKIIGCIADIEDLVTFDKPSIAVILNSNFIKQ